METFAALPVGTIFEYDGKCYQKIVVVATYWPNGRSVPAERTFAVGGDGVAFKMKQHTEVKRIF